jgi:hypothetical protein
VQGKVLDEERAYFATKQATFENEIKQLKQQLSNNFEKETEMKQWLEGMSVMSKLFHH